MYAYSACHIAGFIPIGISCLYLVAWTVPLYPSSVPLPCPCNTQTDGSDYEGGSFSVTFPAGVNVASFNVPIINDTIAECAKLFTLDLEIPAAAAAMGVIRGSPDTATVHIMDDDGERRLA